MEWPLGTLLILLVCWPGGGHSVDLATPLTTTTSVGNFIYQGTPLANSRVAPDQYCGLTPVIQFQLFLEIDILFSLNSHDCLNHLLNNDVVKCVCV